MCQVHTGAYVSLLTPVLYVRGTLASFTTLLVQGYRGYRGLKILISCLSLADDTRNRAGIRGYNRGGAVRPATNTRAYCKRTMGLRWALGMCWWDCGHSSVVVMRLGPERVDIIRTLR